MRKLNNAKILELTFINYDLLELNRGVHNSVRNLELSVPKVAFELVHLLSDLWNIDLSAF